MRLISHCHSVYSFDSKLKLSDLLSGLLDAEVDTVILNDHDACEITTHEVNQFREAGVDIIKAIEFTTKEGVHVIGIGDTVANLTKPVGFYELSTLIELLKRNDLKIIFPHPSHLTGVLGNPYIKDTCVRKAIEVADGVEINNYRYGKTRNIDLKILASINDRLTYFVGADAHSKNEIGTFINEYSEPSIEHGIINYIFEHQPEHVILKEHSALYFRWKELQKTSFYQKSINVLSSEQRKKLKSLFKRN